MKNVTPQAAWARRTQGTTLVTATERGERWTRDDLDLVVAFTDDERDEDIAITLGRSLYAIWNIQNRLRHEGVEGVIASYANDATRVRPLSSRTYTFIGDDVPPGWND